MATAQQAMDGGSCKPNKNGNSCQNETVNSEHLVVSERTTQEPYAGDVIEYKFVEIRAKLDMSKKIDKWQSTPAENRGYEHLSNFYEQGFRMLLFRALPVYDFYTLAFDSDKPPNVHKYSKFQGIFRKQLPSEKDEKWRLRVKNCSLTNQMSFTWHGGVFQTKMDSQFKRVSDCQHILQTINEISQDHGRVVGLEMVDFGAQQFEIEQYKAWFNLKSRSEQTLPKTEVEVDIFYEVPLHSSPEKFIYQTTECQIQASTDSKGLSGKGWKVDSCNMKETFDSFLATGWRLICIFHDNAAEQIIKISGFSGKLSLTQNFVAIFEKPKSREDDATPYFEITVMEIWLQVAPGQGKGYVGELVKLDEVWTKVMRDMGQTGWEVAGIVETPETLLKGGMFSGYKCYRKLKVFFQRPIQPPSYSTLFL